MKKAKPSKREHQADHARREPHEPWPEQPKFKRERGAGNRADDEENASGPTPAPRQGVPRGVTGAQTDALRDTEHEGQANTERGENDVKGQRHRQ